MTPAVGREGEQLLYLALLDSGPLGLITHPNANAKGDECKQWLARLLAEGHLAVVPEITYYEVRRELRRTELKSGQPSQGLVALEAFAADAGLVPITSAAVRLASDLWAEARHRREQGAPDLALDADMILCAQARLINPGSWNADGATVIIATENVKHLEYFTDARHWRDIKPWDFGNV